MCLPSATRARPSGMRASQIGKIIAPRPRPSVRQPEKGDAMRSAPPPSAPGAYALATGAAAGHRLRMLHELYGPGTRRVLLDAGLRPGMRVADLGCGVG